MRALAVLLGDPRDEPGEPVRRELEVQRAARPQPVPGADRLVRAPRVQPDGAERAVRVGVDRLQHVRAVARQQLLRAAVAHVLDALEVGEQRGVARRGERLGGRDADLHPEAPVVLPGAADPRALALLEMGDRADQHELVAVALGVEHGEAAVLAGEPDPPDRDLALERRAGRALDHRPSEAIAMGGLASGRRGLAPRADHRRAAGRPGARHRRHARAAARGRRGRARARAARVRARARPPRSAGSTPCAPASARRPPPRASTGSCPWSGPPAATRRSTARAPSSSST